MTGGIKFPYIKQRLPVTNFSLMYFVKPQVDSPQRLNDHVEYRPKRYFQVYLPSCWCGPIHPTRGAPRPSTVPFALSYRRKIYMASLEAHIYRLHAQSPECVKTIQALSMTIIFLNFSLGWWPVAFDTVLQNGK